jgi:tripartite-type tricarboxylate transporter receptor subunit TctC
MAAEPVAARSIAEALKIQFEEDSMTFRSTKPRRRMIVASLAVGVAALAGLVEPSLAQSAYPNKPIKMLVPFAPGGVSDGSARLVAEHLSRRLGQTVVVENRPGASGNVSGQALAQADPDGYTIALGYNGAMTINPFIMSKMPYDTVKDMAPIGKIGDYPSVITVNPGVEAKTLNELVALSKSQQGGLSYGTSGAGSVEHLIAVMLAQRTGANLVHIAYKGAGPAIADAIAGHIPMTLTSVAGGHQNVKAGKLKAIAVSGSVRSPALPDVPTFVESGLPGFVVNSWIGLVAPGKTPRPIIDKLNAELNASLSSPELRDRLAALGVNATPGTPEAFRDEIKRDLEMNGPIIKAAGIKSE